MPAPQTTTSAAGVTGKPGARLLAEAPDHAPDGVDQRVDLGLGGHDAEGAGARRLEEDALVQQARCRGPLVISASSATTSR